jgi:beta-carotene 15,15'-monooxygenase
MPPDASAGGSRSLGFHTLTEERATTLSVEGRLPAWLSGTLLRNGPGAFESPIADGTEAEDGAAAEHWFDGLAMLRRFTFRAGGIEYRNRFLRTDAYRSATAGEFAGGFATGETTLRERLAAFLLSDTYDNTNVITERIGDRYLALTETPRWVEFDPRTLETIGGLEYDGSEPAGHLACAHVHRDPGSERVVTFETEFGHPSHYHLYEMAAPDRRTPIASVPVERPAYMHSFALTARYAVLTEFPFTVNPLSFFTPGRRGPFVEHYEWEPRRGTRFTVVDRSAGEVVARPRGDAIFGFHHVNAYEAGGELVMDLETVPDADAVDALRLDRLRGGDFEPPAGRIERFRLDPAAADPTVERSERYAGGTALPTVSPARRCRPYRYAYAQGADRPMTEWPREIVKVDVETGTAESFAAADWRLSEPIFVPRPDREREDDGVLLVVALSPAAERSLLVVVDAESMTELARAPLPHALPYDFHGRFFPDPL